MPTQLLFTRFLNAHFAAPVDAFLAALHLTPAHPKAPITNAVSMELLVFIALLCYFLAVRLTLSVEKPGGVQHLAEMTGEFVNDQAESIIGHGFERFIPYLTTLFLFILLANLIGLVPGLESPTANATVPLGFALCTFLYYHYHGIREHGFSYIKQFVGPVWWMSPAAAAGGRSSPTCARVLSLTVRLYANMFAGDLLTLVFFSMIPIGVSRWSFLGLHLGVAVYPGVCIHAAGHDLSFTGGVRTSTSAKR